jgi:hypothetical protein
MFATEKLFIDGDKMLYDRTIRAYIQTPRALEVALFFFRYALILKKVSGPRSNKHLDSKDVALRQILIQAPTKRAVTQMHEPNFAH